MVMILEYIWLALFSIGVYLIVFLFIKDMLTKRAVREKLMGENEKGKKINKTSDPFCLFMVPVKNRLLYYTPSNIKNSLKTLINFSGIKWGIGDMILLKVILALLFAITGFLFVQFSGIFVSGLIVILVLGGTGFIIPDFYLKRKVKLRRRSIKRSLSTFIDYLTISVEAGQGLDMAIYRVISKLQGPLAEEMAYTMTEIKYGKSKKDAFKNLSTRVNISEFTSFLTALTSGEQLGVSIGNILRIQGQQIREKRKQKIQEEAYKIPVKLLFPLVLFILPGLFIVLLGPAAIQILKSF